nr:hypothetical protein [Lysinibacillus timonensis]
MRNAILIDQNIVITVDNTGCVGEKEHDLVNTSNELVAYYTARVALIEQWCAGGQPTHIFMSNFTSDEAWSDYEKGIHRVFVEIGERMPTISGSTESNFESLQSGISIMMVGKKIYDNNAEQCSWFIVGKPLVGEEILNEPEHIAKLNELYMLIKMGVIKSVWPVGSKGIRFECEKLFRDYDIECALPLEKTSGPASSVIVAVDRDQLEQFKDSISTIYEEIKLIQK